MVALTKDSPQPVKHRISGMMAMFLVAAALIFDLAGAATNLIPIAGVLLSIVVTIFAATTFFLWFALLNVNYFKGRNAAKRAVTMAATTLAEIIPFMNALPAFTLGIAVMIALTRREDARAARKKIAVSVVASHRGNALALNDNLRHQKDAA